MNYQILVLPTALTIETIAAIEAIGTIEPILEMIHRLNDFSLLIVFNDSRSDTGNDTPLERCVFWINYRANL